MATPPHITHGALWKNHWMMGVSLSCWSCVTMESAERDPVALSWSDNATESGWIMGKKPAPASGTPPGPAFNRNKNTCFLYLELTRGAWTDTLPFPPSWLAIMARTAAEGAGNHGCDPYRAVNSAMFARSIASA
jgi:hypothetical protein